MKRCTGIFLIIIIFFTTFNVFAEDNIDNVNSNRDNSIDENIEVNASNEESNESSNANSNDTEESNESNNANSNDTEKEKYVLREIDGKIYYLDSNENIQKGFHEIDGKKYFFSNIDGQLKYGWQGTNGNIWYQDKSGVVLTNIQNINSKVYYFNEEGFLQKGFRNIDGKKYFFSNIDGQLKYGWQGTNGNIWYQDKSGVVLTNLQNINNKVYYFNEEGFLQKGFRDIDGKKYFFSNIDGQLKYGWQGTNGNIWYQDKSGVVLTNLQNINNKVYYFNEEGFLQKGFRDIDGKKYFFSSIDGQLKYGWQGLYGNIWYQDESGVVYNKDGWATINNDTYYFKNCFAYIGIREIDGKKYYFEKNGKMVKKTKKTEYKEIVINPSTSEFIKIQYLPKYYNQKDKRWSYLKFGFSTIGSTGCAPTSMAMAFTSILEREILPTEMAEYLYNYTNQYNKIYMGTSGLGIIYACNRYNVLHKGISSKNELIEELKNGRIIFAAMQNGKFAAKTWNHAIITSGYNENNHCTYTYDPLKKENNECTDINIIWNEKSQDPDDLLGGYALYSLYN